MDGKDREDEDVPARWQFLLAAVGAPRGCDWSGGGGGGGGCGGGRGRAHSGCRGEW